jgi:hypothetical protein
MKLIYYILWWLSDRELTIALNTGRNPQHIMALRADVRRWADALDDLEIQQRFTLGE